MVLLDILFLGGINDKINKLKIGIFVYNQSKSIP